LPYIEIYLIDRKSMRIEYLHKFNADRETVEKLMMSSSYCDFVASRHPMLSGIEVLANEDRGGKIFRRIQYTIKPFVRKVGPKEVPPGITSWIEESVFDKEKHLLHFENIPVTDWVRMRIRQSGVAVFEDLPGGKSRRVMRGELHVMLLKFLGKIVERLLSHQAKKLLDREFGLFGEFLRQRGGGKTR